MRNLFRPPSPELLQDTARAHAAIESALPLPGRHLKDLPHAVRDLSRLLTTQRSGLSRSYWSSARLLAAYCRYFLPWNLQRLGRLLPNLRLSLTAGDTILDLGSGPFTLPLALWIACPEWRDLPLTVVCSDTAPHVLDVGRSIFRALAGNDSLWRMETVRAPLDAALRNFRGKAALITAGNVLNELPAPRKVPLESRLEELAALAASRLAPQGRFLAVEPGGRLGGKLISLLRRAAFSAALAPESPCPHWGPCPMLARASTGWCHFSLSAQGAPQALLDLTRQARLEKQDLSLSCMLLRRLTEEELRHAPDLEQGQLSERYAAPPAPTGFARILSDPIRLPGRAAPARYACSEQGLALVQDALRLPSGAAVRVRWPEQATRDPKTNALLLEHCHGVEPRIDSPGESMARASFRRGRPSRKE